MNSRQTITVVNRNSAFKQNKKRNDEKTSLKCDYIKRSSEFAMVIGGIKSLKKYNSARFTKTIV